MEWPIIVLNVPYAVAGVGLMFLAYRQFDAMTPKLHLEEQKRQCRT